MLADWALKGHPLFEGFKAMWNREVAGKLVEEREKLKTTPNEAPLPLYLRGHAEGEKVAVYIRGIRMTYLREREHLITDLGEKGLTVESVEDIVFDKKPSPTSDYDVGSAYIAVRWAQDAITAMWVQPPRLRGREVVLQADGVTAATSLRLMDYMGRTRGQFGEGGRENLAFVSRVYLLAGFTPDMLGRQYKGQLQRQVGPQVQRLESEEMRRSGQEGFATAVACDHPTMAWTATFQNETDKMDLYDFVREGKGEIYLHIADWEDGLRVRVQLDMHNRDPELAMVRAAMGRGRGLGRGVRTLPPATWRRVAQFEGELATLRPIFEAAMGMQYRIPGCFKDYVEKLWKGAVTIRDGAEINAYAYCMITEMRPYMDRGRWDGRTLEFSIAGEVGAKRFGELLTGETGVRLSIFAHPDGTAVDMVTIHQQDPGIQGNISFAAAAGRGAGARGRPQQGEGGAGEGVPAQLQERRRDGVDIQQKMLTEVLKRMDAFTSSQRDAEARMERMEKGMRELAAGGIGKAEPSRFSEVTDLTGQGEEAAGGKGGGGAVEDGVTSPFEEDGGYNYLKAAEGGDPPYPETLEAKRNEVGIKISSPDLYPTAKRLDMGDERKRLRVEYCRSMVGWMVEEASKRGRWVWTPAVTYQKLEHELTFAMCIQPLRPAQVTDLRLWLPPSCRQGPEIVQRAIQSLLADGNIKQRVWGRGVVLYLGDEPRFRGE